MSILQFLIDEILHQINRRKRREALRRRQVMMHPLLMPEPYENNELALIPLHPEQAEQWKEIRKAHMLQMAIGCPGCKYFHGSNGLCCAVHPQGWNWSDGPCPDREVG